MLLNDFNTSVRKSIDLLGAFGKSMDDKLAINFLVEHGIPKSDAIEIFLLLPVAFCRKLLPTVKWQPYYIEEKGKKRVEKRFSENPQYAIIENETFVYWNTIPKKEEILSIAGRSPEFKAINDLLLKGGRLEDIKMSKLILIY